VTESSPGILSKCVNREQPRVRAVLQTGIRPLHNTGHRTVSWHVSQDTRLISITTQPGLCSNQLVFTRFSPRAHTASTSASDARASAVGVKAGV